MTEIDRAQALARARRLRGLSTDRTKLTAFGQVVCHLLDMLEETEHERDVALLELAEQEQQRDAALEGAK